MNMETDTRTNPMTQPARYAVVKAAPRDLLAMMVVL